MNRDSSWFYTLQLNKNTIEKEKNIMLETKYGLKYSMPHSVVHIVDNSMYTGELPTVVVDDPSLYASIVVTGAPMGADNEIIPINRSDVLNVAYGMSNLSVNDIKKFGQTVTYPSALLAQDVPIKFMRVTPEDSTYAFSCLLIQWKWDGTTMHVRFKTTEGNGNNGLPAGVVHANFKNTKRLNNALVAAFKQDSIDLEDGTGVWKQRVIMTTIAAGRGKAYNYYNYAINSTQQSRRPANVRYLFSTIDTRVGQAVERFYGSLINENNMYRQDAVESVNVQVGKRVKGSSILVPTINESAVNELYNDYMARVKEMMDAEIPPESSSSGTSSTEDLLKFVKNVYATMNINIFDIFYGRYIYNGDTDVKLPYFQVDMFDLDIAQLDTSRRINVYLNSGNTETIDDYIETPTDLIDILNTKLYGITNPENAYHIGDVFITNTSMMSLSMITSINQYTGAVTSVPISQIYSDEKKTDNSGKQYREKTQFSGFISASTPENTTDVYAAVQALIDRKKLVPRKIKEGVYVKDYLLAEFKSVKNPANKLTTFGIVKIAYTEEAIDDKTNVVIDQENSKVYSSQKDIYSMLVYPSRITYFATKTGTAAVDNNQEYLDVPGATVITISDNLGMGDPVSDDGDSVVNVVSYDGTIENAYTVENNGKPFVVGTCPTSIKITQDIVNSAYDILMYKNGTVTGTGDDASAMKISWQVNSGTPIYSETTGYNVGDIVSIDIPTGGADSVTAEFKITETTPETIAIEFKSSTTSSTKIPIGTYPTTSTTGTGLKINIGVSDILVTVDPKNASPTFIQRYNVTGTMGSLYRYAADPVKVPANYYSDSYGINPTSELGGISVDHGYAGFFDDDISDIEFKWRYSELLVKAYRGQIDPRIQSPLRCPAKYLFDGGTNTIVGQTILPYMVYKPIDIINASTIYTEDEKEAILLNNDLISNITEFTDIDVKQAMYDLMIYRIYQGIPEEKRPIGPGSGLSLHLDSGVTDANTALMVNASFIKRFSNPNASWDIGGFVSSSDGIAYTYVKQIVDNIFSHMKRFNVNKPYVGKYTNITSQMYTSYFPDVDATDWELRELLYNSGGNAWIVDVNENLQRKSQRTLYREGDTSDIIQESNMRTLSQLTYILQNKIDTYLLEYNDDGVLKTLKDEVDNMFSGWVGSLVTALDITFKRDINPLDGGEIVVCYCNVTFRGLILRVPIIVNIQRRTDSES